jgi:asparaginyl-tRNA synthetase
VRSDPRQAGGVELGVTGLRVLDLCHDWPITPKEHGVDFLMSQRHLWLRSARQVAILKVRSEVESAIHDFYASRGYVRVDSPILTPTACEGTSTLFETQYTEEERPLAVGQLYLERVRGARRLCFAGLPGGGWCGGAREFWMGRPRSLHEVDGLLAWPKFIKELTTRVLDRRKEI